MKKRERRILYTCISVLGRTSVKIAIHATKNNKFTFLPCPIHKDCFRRDTTGVNSSTKKKSQLLKELFGILVQVSGLHEPKRNHSSAFGSSSECCSCSLYKIVLFQ